MLFLHFPPFTDNTSVDLVIPTGVYNQHDIWVGHYLYDSGIPGPPAYALCRPHYKSFSIGYRDSTDPLVAVSTAVVPKSRLNSPGLQIVMQCFQGNYLDRTNGGREWLYFAAVYLAFRIATHIMYGVTLSNTFLLHSYFFVLEL